MKAVIVTDVGQLEFVELGMPQLREYECLVRMRACGLCNGTDLKIIDGRLGNVREQYPIALGHEGVGEVVEVGPKVRNYEIGDIIADPASAVEEPEYTINCAAFCEYGIMQDLQVMEELGLGDEARRFLTMRARAVRADIGFADAAMLVTFKETYSALGNFGLAPGMDLLVFGDGPNGLCLSYFARQMDAGSITVVGHWDKRLARFEDVAGVDRAVNSKSEQIGAALGGMKFDLVIDAVGSASVIGEALPFVKRGGKLGVFGVIPNSDDAPSIREIPNGVSLHMLQWPVGANAVHEEIVGMVCDGRIDPADFYSDVDTWENIEEAVSRIRSRDSFKIILTI